MSQQPDAEDLATAIDLLEYALHLRMYGENAPGGTETWREFDQRCEKFLRSRAAIQRMTREERQAAGVMLTVGGQPFRCTCLANVFTRDPVTDWFTCNGCGAVYQGG